MRKENVYDKWQVTILRPDNPEEELAKIVCYKLKDIIGTINDLLSEYNYNERVSLKVIRTLNCQSERVARPWIVRKFDHWVIIKRIYTN